MIIKRFFDWIDEHTGLSPAGLIFVLWGVIPLIFVFVMSMFSNNSTADHDQICRRQNEYYEQNLFFLHKSGVKYVVPVDKMDQFVKDFNLSDDIFDFQDVDKETFDFASNQLVIPYPDETEYRPTNHVKNHFSR